MRIKMYILLLICTALIFTGCGAKQPKIEPTAEELEHSAVISWFENDMTDEDEFTDLADYRYYARTVGLDKDGLLAPDMWEIYYSEGININKDIDQTAIYLIRLNPDKLLEIWAANNETTPEDICRQIGTNRDDLYYNFGYTGNSVGYAKNHKDGKVSYPAVEDKIFGADNGENRQIVFGTHFLKVNMSNKKKVKYCSTDEQLSLKQRDLLKSVSNPKTYNYSDYDMQEIAPAFYINSIGIRRLLLLKIPNGWNNAVDEKVTLMFNMSPFSFGCTDEDRIELFAEKEPEEADTEEETVTEDTGDAPLEHNEESMNEGEGAE